MKSKVWCLVVGVFLVAGSMATQAAQFGDFTYQSTGTGITITGYTGPGGDVIIPDTINGLPVTSIGDWAFAGCTGLTSIVVPDSVTSIGRQAFEDCTSLTSVTIGNAVISIGDWAFAECTGLTSVTIPDSVTSIGFEAFLGCTGLTSVTIGNGVTSTWRAFIDCTSLTSVMIGNSVTNISRDTFYGCTSLASIDVDALNRNYSSLDGVLFDKAQTTLILFPPVKSGHYSIPNTVTSIGWGAFSGCTGLISIVIPDSVTSIGGSAFQGCTGLTGIDVDSENPIYSSLDGVLFDKAQTTLLLFPLGKSGHYSIPNTVTNIWYAFQGRTGLTGIVIPDSVTMIGDWAFSGCTGLTSVMIGNSVTSIGWGAFSGCTGLTSVVIPDRVHWIGVGAFSGCTGLTSIVIPDRVRRIGVGVFSGCTALTSVYFQGSPPSFTYDVFQEAYNATVYYLPGRPGWEATYGDRPTVLWNPLLSAQGVQMDGFRIGVTGTSEIPIVVEVAADLAESDWTPLYSGTLTDGSLDVTDPDWADDKSRFYRVRSP